MNTLIKHSQVDISPVLIKADVEGKLSQLVDQTREAGLTVNQYFQSKGTTLEKYQQEMAEKVKNEWITNLAINTIAAKNNLTVTDDEVKTLTQKNPQLAQNTNLVYYLLTQQKVFDYLKKL